MFCPNCGTQLPDDAQYCPQCGATFSVRVNQGTTGVGQDPYGPYGANVQQPYQQPYQQSYQQLYQQQPSAQPAQQPFQPYQQPYPPQYQQPYPPADARPPKKKHTALIIVIIVAVITIAVVAILFAVSSAGCAGNNLVEGIMGGNSPSDITGSTATNTPEEATEDFFEAFVGLDVPEMLDEIPPEVLDYYAQQAGFQSSQDLLSEMEAELSGSLDLLDSLNIDLSTLFTFTYGTATEMPESDLASLKETWSERIPGYGDSIKAAAKVPVTVTVNQMVATLFDLDESMTSQTADLTVVLIGERWYMLEDPSSMSLGLF